MGIVLVGRLGLGPQIFEGWANEIVQPGGEILGEVEGFDEGDDVGEVYLAGGGGHAGGEFEFDEGFEVEVADAVVFKAGGGGVGEGNGLGFSVAGEGSGDEEFDFDAGVGIAEVFAAGEGRDVAKAVELLVDFFEGFTGDEDVDVFGEAANAVVEEGHPADDGVGDVEGVESIGDAAEGYLDVAFALEENAAFGQSPPRVVGETLFVGNWWRRMLEGLFHGL